MRCGGMCFIGWDENASHNRLNPSLPTLSESEIIGRSARGGNGKEVKSISDVWPSCDKAFVYTALLGGGINRRCDCKRYIMSENISIAQNIFDKLDNDLGRINGSELYAEQVLTELRPNLKEVPEAMNVLSAAAREQSEAVPEHSLPALMLNRLFGWADNVLRAEPLDAGDFPRWATHIGGMMPSRKSELLTHVNLTDEPSNRSRDTAVKIIDVARKLGLRGVKRPVRPITHAELWDIIDELKREMPIAAISSYDEFMSWGNLGHAMDDVKVGSSLSTLPSDLAESLKYVHCAAIQAAFIRHFIGSGAYLQKPRPDLHKIVEKLISDDLPKARQSFKAVEGELIACRQQVPSAHDVALVFAESTFNALGVNNVEARLPEEEMWRAIQKRVKSLSPLDGANVTNAMKVEAVDAAKRRIESITGKPISLKTLLPKDVQIRLGMKAIGSVYRLMDKKQIETVPGTKLALESSVEAYRQKAQPQKKRDMKSSQARAGRNLKILKNTLNKIT
jgi:hypothetical protein